nr:hypothetical protein [Agrobacterium deltaense]
MHRFERYIYLPRFNAAYIGLIGLDAHRKLFLRNAERNPLFLYSQSEAFLYLHERHKAVA